MPPSQVLSLESTLSSLSLGHEDMVKREQEQADERAQQQREREVAHMAQLQALHDQAQKAESRLKAEMHQAKADWGLQERELKAIADSTKRAKDMELAAMDRSVTEVGLAIVLAVALDLALAPTSIIIPNPNPNPNPNPTQAKAKFAESLSAAQLAAEDTKKVAEEASRRADQAEGVLRSMQQEIMEARTVQQYNAQLHKDLQREQTVRKRLHNEMEDMKGKIRVYVRVRPFSKSERDRGCTESVLRDGKLSVVVKLPDGKKTFDFDQVGG